MIFCVSQTALSWHAFNVCVQTLWFGWRRKNERKMYVCMYTNYIYIYTYIYTYIYIHTCTYTYIHTYTHIYIHIYIHLKSYTWQLSNALLIYPRKKNNFISKLKKLYNYNTNVLHTRLISVEKRSLITDSWKALTTESCNSHLTI